MYFKKVPFFDDPKQDKYQIFSHYRCNVLQIHSSEEDYVNSHEFTII